MYTVYKLFKIFFICILLASCTMYIKNEYQDFSNRYFNKLFVLDEKFVICTHCYAHNSEVYIQAKLFCAKQNKNPKFVEKKYFQDGSLTNPISYIFICE